LYLGAGDVAGLGQLQGFGRASFQSTVDVGIDIGQFGGRHGVVHKCNYREDIASFVPFTVHSEGSHQVTQLLALDPPLGSRCTCRLQGRFQGRADSMLDVQPVKNIVVLEHFSGNSGVLGQGEVRGAGPSSPRFGTSNSRDLSSASWSEKSSMGY